MIEHKQRNILKLVATVLIIAIGVYALVSAYNPKSNATVPSAENNEPPFEMAESNSVQAQPVPPKIERKLQSPDIVRLQRTWGPVLTSWYGEDAPDFVLTDIAGKKHKLSDYRGRNVLITFWATWCRPCLAEIPSLMALRSMIGEDKLAILAISKEPASRVKDFAAIRKINYTVFSYDTLLMGRPYNQTMSIPTSFFIDPQGKIKIITEGTLPFNDIRAILGIE
jgi:peroxiredoxin